MLTCSHVATQRSYDRMSRWYDRVEGWWEKPARDAGVALLRPEAGETILEIGCATGQALRAIAAAAGPGGCAIGLDLSPGMLHVAQRMLQRSAPSAPVHLVCADAAQLPLAAGGVDGVFMSFTLELFAAPEMPVVLGECRRVLKPGGRLCVVALSNAGKPNALVRLYEWAHRRWPAVIDCRPIFVRAAVEQAGLRVIGGRRLSLWGLPVEMILAVRPAA